MEVYRVTTGQRIKEVRKAAGMTQKELAGKLGLAYQTLAQWENDLRKPKIETLERISIVLRVPVKQILDEPSWLHENLRFYRDIDGVSRNKLSAETGIPVSIIKTYEDPCSSRFITEEYLQKIADYFQVPHERVLGYSATYEDMVKRFSEDKAPSTTTSVTTLPEDVQRVASSMEQMNEEGRGKVVDYAEDLEASGRYKKRGAARMGKEA
nr:helix-turn-helix transcriptional regulator [Pseudoflavonifractor sp. 60]